jgi:hypothetical protein
MDQEGRSRLQHDRPASFGVDIRYPADFPETLPGDEARALELARRVKNAATAVLDPYLAGA